MSANKWCVIGTDQRMQKLALEIEKSGEEVLYVKTKAWGYQLERTLLDFLPEKIVFPIQPLEMAVPVINKEIFQLVSACFVGKLTPEWTSFFETNQYTIERYLEDEEFIWLNAKLTAEGFIAAFYVNEKETIAGKKFVIAGFGRVAKLLAAQLKRMDAFPLIVVRSSDQLAEAKAMGYEAEVLTPTLNIQSSYFVNTIPALWFTNEFIQGFINCKTFYDIASAPGCLASDESLPVAYYLYTSLPGQFIENDAAKLLSLCIRKLSNNF
jgi:dipicolinate synthase subunit A